METPVKSREFAAIIKSFSILVACYLTFTFPVHAIDLYSFSSAKLKSTDAAALNGKVSYPIQVDRGVAELEVGSQLDFELPNLKKITLTITKKWQANNGDVQLFAHFENSGTAVITIGQESVYANLNNQEINLAIGFDSAGQAFLIDHRASTNTIDLGDDMHFPAALDLTVQQKQDAISAKAATASDKAEITILIAYSSEFADGFANPLTRINQMIAFSNQAYERSGIHIDLKLAHAAEIPFNNSTNPGTLLSHATNGTNDFTGLHALRDQYYADMVAVLPFSPTGSVSGVAWVNGDRARSSYSVTRFAIWGSDSVFAHELGHNLGSGHERLSANPSQSSPCTGGYTGYACGHGNGSQGTIMSYLNERAWNTVFSNPSLYCNGEPCGIPQGQANAADNKTSFNLSAPLIEAFRIDTSNDDDKDGVKNDVDNCPNVINPDQADNDDDNIGDVCDPDDDNDGVNDGADNCPLEENADQLDRNGNGIGDACEDDEFCFPLKARGERTVMICL